MGSLKNLNANVDADSDADAMGTAIALPGLRPDELKNGDNDRNFAMSTNGKTLKAAISSV